MRWIVGRGLVGSCLLVVSGLVYSRVPVGSWVLDLPVVVTLRQRPDHVALGVAVASVGLILLTSGWWSLVRSVTGAVGGVRRAWLATGIWVLPLLVAPPLFSNDGWSYVATGYLAGHRLSPYVVTPSVLPASLRSAVAPVWRHTTSPYGPIPLVWGGWWSHLTADPWLLLAAHRLLAGLGLLLLAVAVPRLARRAGHDPARATAIAVASPFVVAQGIGGLHNDMLLVGLMALALCLTRRDRWWWGAVTTGLAASVKAPGLLVLVGVVLLSLVPAVSMMSRLRRAASVAFVALGTLLAVSLGSGLGLGWIHGLGATADAPPRMAPTALAGRWLGTLLRATGPTGHAIAARLDPVSTAKDLGLLALVLVVLGALLWWKVPDERRAITGGAVVLLAATLLSPALHYWYFMWCLPLLACVPLRKAPERTFLVLLVLLGLATVADPALHIFWFSDTALLVLLVAPMAVWGVTAWASGRSVGSDRPPRRTLGRS